MSRKKSGSGIVMVVAAGILWGLISIFVRRLNVFGLDSFEIMTFRSFLSVIILALYFLVRDRQLFKIRIRDIWMFIGTGLLSLTFFSFCYFTTIVESGAAIAVVLLYTSPIFVMLMSAVVFKEKITKVKALAILMTFSGCVLVSGIAEGGRMLSMRALLVGLGAGLGYALYSIFAGFAVKRYSSLTITFYTFLLSGISLLVVCNLGEIVSKIRRFPTDIWAYLFGIALVCTVLPYLAYTFGLKRMDKGKAAVLVTVEPLVGTLLGIFVYKEMVSILSIIGMVLIFASVISLAKE